MPCSTLPRRCFAVAVPVLITAGVLTGCGTDTSTGSARSVAVEATDDSCTVAETTLDAGRTTFAVSNKGSKTTEVYVYGESGGAFTKVIGEVENVGPGTSRDLTVSLGAGSYEVACKPGQQGDGIRTAVTVTGAGSGAGSGSASEAAYDRELELRITAAGLTGLDPATGTRGERVEVKLENGTDGARTLELLDPAGKVVTEFEVAAGADGEAVVELGTAGAWTVKVEGGPKDVEQTLTVR